jgi:hypothetical protein
MRSSIFRYHSHRDFFSVDDSISTSCNTVNEADTEYGQNSGHMQHHNSNEAIQHFLEVAMDLLFAMKARLVPEVMCESDAEEFIISCLDAGINIQR